MNKYAEEINKWKGKTMGSFIHILWMVYHKEIKIWHDFSH